MSSPRPIQMRSLTCSTSGSSGPQSTYIYRVQSSVWRLPNYWTPTPLHPASVSSPCTKGGGRGGAHTPGGEGWGGGSINISEDAKECKNFQGISSTCICSSASVARRERVSETSVADPGCFSGSRIQLFSILDPSSQIRIFSIPDLNPGSPQRI